jgi:hypothetical protein
LNKAGRFHWNLWMQAPPLIIIKRGRLLKSSKMGIINMCSNWHPVWVCNSLEIENPSSKWSTS